MRTTGACFCGAIEYVASIDENRIGVCHCRDCQVLSGSAFRTTTTVEPGSFEVTRGELRFFEKTADSGRVRRLGFCGDCGTHICSLPGDSSQGNAYVGLRVGTSVDFASLQPAAEIWCRSRVPWMPPIEGLRRFDAQF